MERKAEMRLSVGILAGGKSTRMGRDKALLPAGDRTMIERIAEELGGFSEVLVSAAEEGAYRETGLRVCPDERPGIGPIEGIRQVLRAAKEDYAFICAADMPFIRKEAVLALAAAIRPGDDCCVLTRGGQPEPLCAVYSRRVLPLIDGLIAEGCYRPRALYPLCRVRYVPLEETGLGPETVENLNTPEEYAAAEPRLRNAGRADKTGQKPV